MPGQSGPEFKAQVESVDNRALTPQDLKDQETINNFLKTPKGKEAVTKAQNNSQNELVELSNAAKLNKAENVTNAIINLVNANRKINISNERMKDVTSIGEYVNKLSSKDGGDAFKLKMEIRTAIMDYMSDNANTISMNDLKTLAGYVQDIREDKKNGGGLTNPPEIVGKVAFILGERLNSLSTNSAANEQQIQELLQGYNDIYMKIMGGNGLINKGGSENINKLTSVATNLMQEHNNSDDLKNSGKSYTLESKKAGGKEFTDAQTWGSREKSEGSNEVKSDQTKGVVTEFNKDQKDKIKEDLMTIKEKMKTKGPDGSPLYEGRLRMVIEAGTDKDKGDPTTLEKRTNDEANKYNTSRDKLIAMDPGMAKKLLTVEEIKSKGGDSYNKLLGQNRAMEVFLSLIEDKTSGITSEDLKYFDFSHKEGTQDTDDGKKADRFIKVRLEEREKESTTRPGEIVKKATIGTEAKEKIEQEKYNIDIFALNPNYGKAEKDWKLKSEEKVKNLRKGESKYQYPEPSGGDPYMKLQVNPANGEKEWLPIGENSFLPGSRDKNEGNKESKVNFQDNGSALLNNGYIMNTFASQADVEAIDANVVNVKNWTNGSIHSIDNILANNKTQSENKIDQQEKNTVIKTGFLNVNPAYLNVSSGDGKRKAEEFFKDIKKMLVDLDGYKTLEKIMDNQINTPQEKVDAFFTLNNVLGKNALGKEKLITRYGIKSTSQNEAINSTADLAAINTALETITGALLGKNHTYNNMTQLPNGEHVLGKNQAILPGKEVPVSFTTQQELTDFYAQLDKLSALDGGKATEGKRQSNLIQFGYKGIPN